MVHRKVEVGPVPVKSNMAVPLVKTVTPSLMKLTIHKCGGPARITEQVLLVDLKRNDHKGLHQALQCARQRAHIIRN